MYNTAPSYSDKSRSYDYISELKAKEHNDGRHYTQTKDKASAPKKDRCKTGEHNSRY
uniref:Uncharacterized protein n=1 Tax=uncultured Alphaproteobacteria bacterium TaxID=91750 RepID=A0A6M4NQC7_9PROT|nr:hypothetical protein PlAlph_2150 [uncultured Alphaproteobacteria bacterium]